MGGMEGACSRHRVTYRPRYLPRCGGYMVGDMEALLAVVDKFIT